MNMNKHKSIDPHAFWSAFGHQKELAKQNHTAACRAVDELRVETEKRVGAPVRIRYLEAGELPGPTDAQMAWDYGRDHHLLCSWRKPENLRPPRLASLLLWTQLEAEARDAGKRRRLMLSEQQMHEIVSRFEPRFGSDFAAQLRHRLFTRQMTELVFGMFLASTRQMLVEERLHNRFPVLRPAQFVSLSTIFLNTEGADRKISGLPRLLDRTLGALIGLEALFHDHLFGGTTNFAACREGSNGFDLARRLWDHWQANSPTMGPGDQFAMLDDFARILDLSGHFLWVYAPPMGGAPNTPPGSAPEGN